MAYWSLSELTYLSSCKRYFQALVLTWRCVRTSCFPWIPSSTQHRSSYSTVTSCQIRFPIIPWTNAKYSVDTPQLMRHCLSGIIRRFVIVWQRRRTFGWFYRVRRPTLDGSDLIRSGFISSGGEFTTALRQRVSTMAIYDSVVNQHRPALSLIRHFAESASSLETDLECSIYTIVKNGKTILFQCIF